MTDGLEKAINIMNEMLELAIIIKYKTLNIVEIIGKNKNGVPCEVKVCINGLRIWK